ncbi:hybrid sensor histidine kinase/response regulator [Halopseudomonas sp.]|uniref:hybrid sensor histidine kinase/response regulator n=1 Tax=Halopseudomonas sp. TaxID=2901191 RepID=UPI00311DB42A
MTLDAIERQISFDALAPHFATMREWAVFTVLVPLTVVIVLWQSQPPLLLLGWFALLVLGIVARFLLTRAYQRADVTPETAAPWHQGLLAIAVYCALLWVSAAFLFFVEESAPLQLFLVTLLVTLGVGSLSSGTHWLPLYYGYGTPILLALAIKLMSLGELAYVALSLMVFATLIATIAFTRKLNGIVRSEMRLHIQGVTLAEELQQQSEALQEAIHAKSRVLATASHDLRQPLHALSLFVDALKGVDDEREKARVFGRIDQSLNAMRKLFDALFDISRLDANVVQPEYSHFDIATCLGGLYEEYRETAERHHLQLRMHVPSVVVQADRALLERIMRNLISNALRYTRRGGVLISARRRQGRVLLQVWDTGVGIPPDRHEQAFTEFQQLQRSNDERDKGLGFGLAIVRRLCELLEYPLQLRSEVGRGSVFSFCIPQGDPEQARRVEREQGQSSWSAAGKLILVIDDDRNVLNAMETLLSGWRFDVIACEHLDEALHMLRSGGRTPDLVLSDLSLGEEVSGVGAVAQVRAMIGRSIPALLVTGETSREQLHRAEASGLKLLHKPVRPLELRGAIQHQLSLSASPS